MIRVQSEQSGFSAVEAVLVVVIVGVIGFIGWYVFAAQNKTSQILSGNGAQQVAQSSGGASGNTPGASDNAALQSQLNSITSSSGQSNQDLTGATNAINDKSTFTAVPQ